MRFEAAARRGSHPHSADEHSPTDHPGTRSVACTISRPPPEPNRERWAKWAERSAGVSGGQGSRKPGIALKRPWKELGRDGNFRKMRPRTKSPVLLRTVSS